MRKTRNEVAKQLVKSWASLEVQGLYQAADFLQAAVGRVRWRVWRAGHRVWGRGDCPRGHPGRPRRRRQTL